MALEGVGVYLWQKNWEAKNHCVKNVSQASFKIVRNVALELLIVDTNVNFGWFWRNLELRIVLA